LDFNDSVIFTESRCVRYNHRGGRFLFSLMGVFIIVISLRENKSSEFFILLEINSGVLNSGVLYS
jgi:hypothetical protein